MFTFKLKTGESVQVELKNLAEFLRKNKDNLVTRQLEVDDELDIEGIVPDPVVV